MDNNDNFNKFTDFENDKDVSFGSYNDDPIIDLNSFSSTNEERRESRMEARRNAKQTKKSKILKVILSIFLVCVITGSIVVGAFMVYAFSFVDADMEENLDDLVLNCTTTIYVKDETGNFKEYQRLHGEFNRIWISDRDGNIPENLKNAYIAVEDQRFRSHEGVDWKRTFSAFANLFFHFYSSNQGGSTITQQLVKNLTGDNSQSPSRKIREILRARDLESRFSKDTILECYLNTISMGGGMYGVEVASNYYFGKSAKDLDLAECAALASIAKEPEGYRPDKKPEANKERRQTVLNLMLEQEFITQEEHDKAYNEELKIVASKERLNEIAINSYFVDALISDVQKGLVELYDFDEKHAATNFYNGGYKIYATLDPKVQSAVEEVFSDESYQYVGKDGKLLQGSMTVMDYEGHVLGIAGAIGKKTANRVLNRATSSPRQPGSTMKPMSAYSLAIEKDLITYSSIVNDTERYYRNWKPNNWYNNGGYKGKMTVERALEISCNTIPVMLVDTLTPQTSYNFLIEKLGIKHLNSNDIDYSPLGMGGTNGGLTTLEEAAAYAVFGNGGLYHEPTTYYKVTDQHDKVILEYDTKSVVALGEDTATVMNHLLRNVVTGSEGTGKGAKNAAGGMPIYAKTGTSNDDMNCWFTGGTPYVIGSVWCGYDTLQTVKQNATAKNMWIRVMEKIHAGLEKKDFTDSPYAVPKYYCTRTGLLATDSCPSKKQGWYKTSNIPSMCTSHPHGSAPSNTSSSAAATSSQTASQTPQSPQQTPAEQPEQTTTPN
ncbi:MAG: transglycosylase domain-containing protein [Clostridiales bacterium]|nr:transglycosylase domain-containing protein [Candidatus Equinaster intestinalis]